MQLGLVFVGIFLLALGGSSRISLIYYIYCTFITERSFLGGGEYRSLFPFSVLLNTWNNFFCMTRLSKGVHSRKLCFSICFFIPSDWYLVKRLWRRGTCDRTKNLELEISCLWVILGPKFSTIYPLRGSMLEFTSSVTCVQFKGRWEEGILQILEPPCWERDRYLGGLRTPPFILFSRFCAFVFKIILKTTTNCLISIIKSVVFLWCLHNSTSKSVRVWIFLWSLLCPLGK